MSDYLTKRILLVGAGQMAQEYAKVLIAQNEDFDVVGRGKESAQLFSKQTGLDVISGGIHEYLTKEKEIPEFAIVAVNVEHLAEVTIALLDFGVKNILVEKPAGLNYGEIVQVEAKAKQKNANVYTAYNRRFYASVIHAKKMIQEDQGILSFNFEFTEWSHLIEKLKKENMVKQEWLLANSSHVIDLAFYLGGTPVEMNCHKSGCLTWHERGAVFVGAGKTNHDALFSYHANWMAPGRWGVEVMTSKHRFILRPLEKLQVQNIGEISAETVLFDDSLDIQFKPGIYREVEAFLAGKAAALCKISDQITLARLCDRILRGETYKT